MRERPILFSAPMVRAILAGNKTQTRRVVKPWEPRLGSDAVPADVSYLPDFTCYRATCPYGKPGDRLWVRETWAAYDADWRHPGKPADLRDGPWPNVAYAADGDFPLGVGRPSIHMPRWACRLVLQITQIRVERLNDISHEDAELEGVKCNMSQLGFRDHFQRLWEHINGAGSWAANPWVWVVEFDPLPHPKQHNDGGADE